MFLKKALTLLALTAQLCSSLELEPIAKYAGQHSSRCWKNSVITGALVKDKIYTFGGCYPLPYIVNPEEDDDVKPFYSMGTDKFNTSSSIHAYDITQDTWTLEPTTATPFPLNGARLQVVNNDDVYFLDINTEPDHRRSSMWRYSTSAKEWKMLDQLPFIWLGGLVSCERNGVIYMVGSEDVRNRIQRYDTIQNEWLEPLVSDLKVSVKNMLCAEDSIQLAGRKLTYDDEIMVFHSFEETRYKDIEFFTLSYQNGKTVENGFNVTVSMHTSSKFVDNWLYTFDVRKNKETIIKKANPLTQQVVELGTLNQTLRSVLYIPYQHETLYLLGGDKSMFRRNRQPVEGALKTYNHKIQLVDQEITTTTEDQQIVIQDNTGI